MTNRRIELWLKVLQMKLNPVDVLIWREFPENTPEELREIVEEYCSLEVGE